MRKRGRPPTPDPLRRYGSFRTLQPRGQWGAVRKSLQELIEAASPAAVQAEASRCVALDADALQEAAEYLQQQYRKLHKSEAYLSPGEWERRSRLVTIKVTDFEFQALSSQAEVTGLTESQLMRLALAGKAHELGRGSMNVPRPGIRQQRTPPRTIAPSRESCFPMMSIVDLPLPSMRESAGKRKSRTRGS